MKRTITILLLASMLLSAASCGSTDSGTHSDTTGDTTPEVTTEADPYGYPDIDLEGETFTFLMPAADMWDMHCTMDLEAQTGEPLDDAIYNRNRDIEDKYNFKIEVIYTDKGNAYYEIGNVLRTDVMAGDNTYDAAYMCGTYVGSLVTEDLLMDLNTLNGLNLDEAWWNQVTIDASYIDDQIYFAQGDLSLSSFDLTWCLFFNEDMMDELKLEKPYDLVREENGRLTGSPNIARPPRI